MTKDRHSKDLVRDEVIAQLKNEKSNLLKEVKKLRLEIDLLKIAFSESHKGFTHRIH
jgi:hypothetical protein